MIIDSEEYITTPISKYLEDMINIVGYQSIPLHLRMILTYILSNTFLLMVGALEKKLEMISWHIAHDDYEYRYDYIRKQNTITADMKRVNDLYNHLGGESSSKKKPYVKGII